MGLSAKLLKGAKYIVLRAECGPFSQQQKRDKSRLWSQKFEMHGIARQNRGPSRPRCGAYEVNKDYR
jgi:hypothetical protein